jgi:hypothetical protein
MRQQVNNKQRITKNTMTTTRRSLTPDESALSRKRRCQTTILLSDIPILQEISPQVLEIVSQQGGGKTELLLNIAKKCAISGMIVAYLDVDCKLTDERIRQTFINENDETRGRLLITRPFDGQQLLQAIHLAVDKKCRVVMIDSLLSVHWLLSLTEPLSAGLSVSFPSTLWRLRQQHGFVVVAAKPSFSLYKNDASFISKTWANGVTHRLYLRDGEVIKLAVVKDGVDVVEAAPTTIATVVGGAAAAGAE